MLRQDEEALSNRHELEPAVGHAGIGIEQTSGLTGVGREQIVGIRCGQMSGRAGTGRQQMVGVGRKQIMVTRVKQMGPAGTGNEHRVEPLLNISKFFEQEFGLESGDDKATKDAVILPHRSGRGLSLFGLNSSEGVELY